MMEFDEPLPPGEYFVEAEGVSLLGGTVPNQVSMFMVSDLGMVILRAPEKTVVRAIDLKTLKPVQGATISRGSWR
ncbi:hypothetical protein ABTJ72_18845, partial [Acinetobacter baumannii]